MSEAVEPIIYYLDRGAPEPIRSALLDGARWWNQAFEAAGYKNAFRVEMLPEGVDPMDVRYNLLSSGCIVQREVGPMADLSLIPGQAKLSKAMFHSDLCVFDRIFSSLRVCWLLMKAANLFRMKWKKWRWQGYDNYRHMKSGIHLV